MTDIDRTAVYKEICENIRETDRISFKLLSLIPAASGLGAAALTLFQKSALVESIPLSARMAAIVLLSVAAAAIVFGLYKWELRNVQKCEWLISRAAALEKVGEITQYEGWDKEKRSWGKTRAEKLIYRVAIAVWLVPVAMVVLTW